MTKLEQAAKQALEVLERLEGLHLSRGITCSGIIANLREALEQPAAQWQGQGSCVACGNRITYQDKQHTVIDNEDI